MAKKNDKVKEQVVEAAVESVRQANPEVTQDAVSQLINALVSAIQLTKPVEKKTFATFKSRTAFTPKNGEPRAKLKRKSYHHGILQNRDGGRELLSNEEIELFNKIRPGTYCDGHVTVTRRRDRGVDVDYPVKTASQRLQLVNKYGIRNFKELLERIVAEGENPKAYARPEDDDI